MTAFESARAIAGVSGAVGYNPEIRLLPSIAQIPKEAWQEMLPGEPECWDFYRTAEGVPPPGFSLSAIAYSFGKLVCPLSVPILAGPSEWA